jgi:purine catabolism regulator
MIDPTPFLGPAEVILTLGWQFPVTHAATSSIAESHVPADRLQRIYDDYVDLVAAHGVIGIGFGSDVVHKGVPPELGRACRRHGLILFDVPYEISFMDLLQEAALVMQRDHSARTSRSLRAQKAIANAATRRDGMHATLRETARQLGCGVALYDPLGHVVTSFDPPGRTGTHGPALGPIVKETLATEQRFRSVETEQGAEVILQLLGEPGDITGVLVLILSQGFDDLSRNVLSSVLALVSVSLEQNQVLSRLHSTLREALLQLMLSGNESVSGHILERLWGSPPTAPLAVMVGIPRQADLTQHLRSLEALQSEVSCPTFFAPYRGDVAVVTNEDDADVVLGALGGYQLAVGRSGCETWDGLAHALEEARRAAEVGLHHGTGRALSFTEIWRSGVSELIDASDAAHVARRTLAPIVDADRRTGSELVTTLRTWLHHRGRAAATSRELGIHRHTLENRIQNIAALLDSDLDDFDTQIELGLALRYLLV